MINHWLSLRLSHGAYSVGWNQTWTRVPVSPCSLYTCLYLNLSISSKSASWKLSVKSKYYERNSQHGHVSGLTAFLQEILVCVFCQNRENPTRALTQNIQSILNGLKESVYPSTNLSFPRPVGLGLSVGTESLISSPKRSWEWSGDRPPRSKSGPDSAFRW